jgi:S-disulfanyl-L-cysteine oxidoreductase SoxD
MNASRGFLVIVGALTMGLSYGVVRAQDKTVWDGVYSDAQAKRGEAVFGDKCAKCHGADLSGGDAPTLVGSEFGGNWDDLSLGDLAERIRVSMPQDNPQSLTRDQVADLLAFILKSNKVPAGQADLPAAADSLKVIKYKANKP